MGMVSSLKLRWQLLWKLTVLQKRSSPNNSDGVNQTRQLRVIHMLQIAATVDDSIPPEVKVSVSLFQTALAGTWHEGFANSLKQEALDAILARPAPGSVSPKKLIYCF